MTIHSEAKELLLACLSVGDERKYPAVDEYPPPVWQSTLAMAEQHKVSPLLYHQLNTRNLIDSLPEGLSGVFRDSNREEILENLALMGYACQIMKDLEQEEIPVMPLKGVLLAGKIYPNAAFRSMRDVDLLIPDSRLQDAANILEKVGYEAHYQFNLNTERKAMHHLPSLYGPKGVVVELHWTLMPPSSPFRIDVDSIWQRAKPGELLGAACAIMSVEDLLLHLCMHTAYLETLSSGLRPFCDLAWTLRIHQQQIDWQRLIYRAGDWGCRRSTWLALQLTRRLLGAPVPEGALLALQTNDVQPDMIDWATAQVLYPMGYGGKLATAFAPNPPLVRFRVATGQFLPAAHEMRKAYPTVARSIFWPLAYLRHFAVVVRRNWGTVWKILRGDTLAREATDQRQRVNRLVRWQENG